ncbi:hypothetical protein AAVH_38410, partial [Aphelenchoides avenae]
MACAPKKIEVFHGGETANANKRKQDGKTLEQRKEDRANAVQVQAEAPQFGWPFFKGSPR